ncbi:FAD-dependent oxidoreductase [Corynebacterium kalidii]
MRAHDIIVIGGGAAGLSAAELLGRARRDVLVIDSAAPRNRFAPHMHGVLGHDGVPPLDLLDKGRAELDAYGVAVTTGSVESVTEIVRGLKVTCTDGTVAYARAVLVASGIDDTLPDIPGLAEHWGDAVFQCPYCHGWEHRDRRIGVLASSPMVFQYAQLVRNWTADLTVFVTGTDVLTQLDDATRRRFDARGVSVVTSPVTETVSTDGTLTGVRTEDGAVHPVDAIGLHPHSRPRDGFLAPLGLDRTEVPGVGSFVAVDAVGQTSHPRVWAAGNVVDPRANVPTAMGQASMTAGMLNTTLVTEDTDNAVHALTAPSSHHDWPEVADDGFWETTYAQAPPRWSGRPNPSLVRVLTEELGGAGTARGRAADIGCGEGADAVWLAQQGWDTLGVEVSATAVRRAQDAAAAAGVDGVRFTDVGVQGLVDAAATDGSAPFDLVTASYLHGPSQGRRSALLLDAGELVAPGGYLFLLSHVMPDAAPEEYGAVDALGFDDDTWELVRDETVDRAVIGLDGEVGGHPDRVVLLRRR